MSPSTRCQNGKRIYFEVLGVIMERCLTTRFLVSTESKRPIYYCEQLAGPRWGKSTKHQHAVGPWHRRRTWESHHRGQMKEGQHRKTRIRHKHHIYVHIQWSKKNTHTYTSEIWLAFDNFQKVNVCICFYTKYNFFFKTIFWVVQFFFSDSSWLITFTNSLRVKNKKTHSYPFHSITQIAQSCCVNIKNLCCLIYSLFYFFFNKGSATLVLKRWTECVCWSVEFPSRFALVTL